MGQTGRPYAAHGEHSANASPSLGFTIQTGFLFDTAQHRQQFRGRDVGYRAVADPRENVPLEQTQQSGGVHVGPVGEVSGVPLQGNRLERTCLGGNLGGFGGLAVFARIGFHPPIGGGIRRDAPGPVSGKRRDRRPGRCVSLFRRNETLTTTICRHWWPPQDTARDRQTTFGAGRWVWLVEWRGRSVAWFASSQRLEQGSIPTALVGFGGNRFSISLLCPQNCPQLPPDFMNSYWTTLDGRTQKSQCFHWLSALHWIPWDPCLVGPPGFEPGTDRL